MIASETLVIFATHWGYRHGGINTFNIELARAIARLAVSAIDVVCVVPEASSQQLAMRRTKAAFDSLVWTPPKRKSSI